MEQTVAQDAVYMAAGTDVGLVRKNNEDAYYFSRKEQFFFLCDGMGGHESGEVASKLAVETMQHVVTQPLSFNAVGICADIDQNLPNETKILVSAVRYANRRILHNAINSPQMRGMGTTIVAAIYKNGLIYTAHVGDSRIYRLRRGKLTQLTSDHSWLNELLEDNEISENEIKDFNEKNVLTRALGTYPTVKIDVQIESVEEGDLFILCSDGLHNALSDAEIERMLNSSSHNSLQDAVDRLIQHAKKSDGSDNITAGLIYIPAVSNKKQPYRFKKVISEEPEQISQQLDKTIKNYYSLPKPQKSNVWKWALTATAGIAALALAFYLNWQQDSDFQQSNNVSSALFNEDGDKNDEATRYLTPAQIQDAGRLVLLQVRDSKYIELLKSLKYVKVLDAPKQFKKNIPIHAGMFTWAIADSSDYILYKNNAIQLSPLTEWGKGKNGTVTNNSINGSRTTSVTNSEVPANRGLVYLVGSFQNANYNGSNIFANDRQIGSVQNYLDEGFLLRPGNYTITIRADSGRIQKTKRDVEVVNGHIIAVEF